MTHRRALRHLAALIAAFGLLLTAGSAATAATWTHVDPSHDVLVGDVTGNSYAPAPGVADVDITRITVQHTRSTVVVRVKTRAALPRGGWFTLVSIKTPTRRYDATHGRMFGQSLAMLSYGSGTKAPCSGMRHVVDRAHRVVVLRVPRTCLKDPRWVKVGAGVVHTVNSKGYVDESQRRGTDPDNENLVLGPRVRVG